MCFTNCIENWIIVSFEEILFYLLLDFFFGTLLIHEKDRDILRTPLAAY